VRSALNWWREAGATEVQRRDAAGVRQYSAKCNRSEARARVRECRCDARCRARAPRRVFTLMVMISSDTLPLFASADGADYPRLIQAAFSVIFA
jgi:hypothetical protein